MNYKKLITKVPSKVSKCSLGVTHFIVGTHVEEKVRKATIIWSNPAVLDQRQMQIISAQCVINTVTSKYFSHYIS